MSRPQQFYDRYHLQNRAFAKVIKRNNFTYFYSLEFLHLALLHTKTARNLLKVLDIGCGVGALSLYLGKWGVSVDGIDISERAIRIAERARRDLELFNVGFIKGELKKGRGQYHVVVCSEVIEHIPKDGEFLDLIASQLKPGGVLFLTTPSTENWLYKAGFYKEFDQRVGHLRRYTPASLRKLLKEHGFKVVKLRTVEGPLRNLLFTTPLGKVIRLIRGPLVPAFHWFDRLWARVAGAADIQVIAVKGK